MKKIISCIILISCIFNMILPISIVYAEENTEYECIQLPIISDKSKKEVTDITLYKDSDTLYAPLHTICPLINAEWHMKDGGFYVERDGCTYFRYYSNGNMKLIVDLGIGDDKWNKSDNVLIEGNLFSCKKIGVEWCVDFIKFCDMFGVTFFKVSQNTIQSAKDNIKKNIGDSSTESLNDIVIENDLDFVNHPYYIYIYSGTPLISLYGQVMGNENLYLWDYSCYENLDQSKEGDSWLEKTLKNIQYSSIATGLTVQSQNWLSNLVNDDWGITRIITAPPYESSEHYKKALVNISGINYGRNLKLEDIESINQNNKAQDLERLLNSNSIISSSDSTITILNKYLNNQIKIPELESFTKLSDVINCVGTPFQTYFEVEDFHNKLNSINENKIQLLTKSIAENEYINKISKIQEKGNSILNFSNKTMANNILLNSIDNYTGLINSSKEICSLYKNSDGQFKEKLSQSIESELYALGDSAISKILEKSGNPYLVLTGAVIGVYDGFTAWTKENFGEQLQSSEILVQAYFIERTMKESLDIKSPENLYNRLTLMLQSSLCCFEYDENCFQTNRNKISKILYMLDNDKSININYYHDPRNNNVDENVKNAILNYSDTLVVPIEDETQSSEPVEIQELNYEWHLDPTIEAEDIIVIDNKDNFLEEGYKSPYDECALIKKNGKYGIIKYDGTNIAESSYDMGGYNILGDIGVWNQYNESEGLQSVDVLSNKGELKIQKNQEGGWGYEGVNYYWDINEQEVYQYEGSPVYDEHTDNLSYNVVVQSADIQEDGNISNKSDKYGIANQNKLLVPIEYDKGYMHSFNSVIALEKNNKWTYYDESGKTIIENCEGFKSNSQVVDWWEGGGYNYNEDYILPYIPTENYIPVKIDGQCGYYDTQGNEIIPCGTFEEVRPVHNGFAWVKKDGKWGVIELENNQQKIIADELINKTLLDIINMMKGTYEITTGATDDVIYISNQSVIPGMQFKIEIDCSRSYDENGLNEQQVRNDIEQGIYSLNSIKVNGNAYATSELSANMRYEECCSILGSNLECNIGTIFSGAPDSECYTFKKDNTQIELHFDVISELISNGGTFSYEDMIQYNPSLNCIILKCKDTVETMEQETKTPRAFTQEQLNSIRKSLGVPEDLEVTIEQETPFYWEIGETWITHVSIYCEESIIASVDADSITAEFIKEIMMYSISIGQSSNISDNQILKAVNKYLEENQSHLGVYLSNENPYCPAEFMYSNDTNWSCPINTHLDIYTSNTIAGSHPHFAFVDKTTQVCTITAGYETVVEFDLSEYIN